MQTSLESFFSLGKVISTLTSQQQLWVDTLLGCHYSFTLQGESGVPDPVSTFSIQIMLSISS